MASSGSSKAHVALRQKLIEQNRLDGVVSMPGGVFKPYAGVSTAVLLFTRGADTDRIWYYDTAHDGFNLDDKRQPVPENDIPFSRYLTVSRPWGSAVEERPIRVLAVVSTGWHRFIEREVP